MNKNDKDDSNKPQNGMCYVICASPRTGSSLLARTLWDMGIGLPDEYLNPVVAEKNPPGWPDFMQPTPAAYVEKLKQARSVNGIFGLKTHYIHIARCPEIADHITTLFPDAKYISLTRRNILRQAISRTRATQTMSWNSDMKECKAAKFNFFAIIKHMIAAVEEIEGWDKFYARHGIKPMRVVYENLESDYEGTMRSVASFLEVQCEIPPQPLKKQADGQTELWVDEFINYFQRRPLIRRVVRRVSQHW